MRYYSRESFVSVEAGVPLGGLIETGLGTGGVRGCALNCSDTEGCIAFDHDAVVGTCLRFSTVEPTFCRGGGFRCRSTDTRLTTYVADANLTWCADAALPEEELDGGGCANLTAALGTDAGACSVLLRDMLCDVDCARTLFRIAQLRADPMSARPGQLEDLCATVCFYAQYPRLLELQISGACSDPAIAHLLPAPFSGALNATPEVLCSQHPSGEFCAVLLRQAEQASGRTARCAIPADDADLADHACSEDCLVASAIFLDTAGCCVAQLNEAADALRGAPRFTQDWLSSCGVRSLRKDHACLKVFSCAASLSLPLHQSCKP